MLYVIFAKLSIRYKVFISYDVQWITRQSMCKYRNVDVPTEKGWNFNS